jgi:hypothetical protein
MTVFAKFLITGTSLTAASVMNPAFHAKGRVLKNASSASLGLFEILMVFAYVLLFTIGMERNVCTVILNHISWQVKMNVIVKKDFFTHLENVINAVIFAFHVLMIQVV